MKKYQRHLLFGLCWVIGNAWHSSDLYAETSKPQPAVAQPSLSQPAVSQPAVSQPDKGSTVAPAKKNAKARHFQLDLVHSQIFFEVDHIGFSTSRGHFKLQDGQFFFDPNNPSASWVKATIDVGSLDLGDAKWNEKMLDRTFFDVKQYPTAHFQSTGIAAVDEKHWVIDGELSLHGVKKIVRLETQINRMARHPYSMKYTAGFSARTTIKRSDFGIDAYLPAIGDDIQLHIEIEGNKDTP